MESLREAEVDVVVSVVIEAISGRRRCLAIIVFGQCLDEFLDRCMKEVGTTLLKSQVYK